MKDRKKHEDLHARVQALPKPSRLINIPGSGTLNKSSTGYMAGYDSGKEAYHIGGQSRFYTQGSHVWDRLGGTEPTVVEPDSLDFARGYIDGYERAQEASHD